MVGTPPPKVRRHGSPQDGLHTACNRSGRPIPRATARAWHFGFGALMVMLPRCSAAETAATACG
eukprot:3873540-Prorocentrum_lima.AAC.1